MAIALNRITNNANNTTQSATDRWINIRLPEAKSILGMRMLIYATNTANLATISEIEVYNGVTKISNNGASPALTATATSQFDGAYIPSEVLDNVYGVYTGSNWFSATTTINDTTWQAVMLKFNSGAQIFDRIRFLAKDTFSNRAIPTIFEWQFTNDPTALVTDVKNSSKWFSFDLINGTASNTEFSATTDGGATKTTFSAGNVNVFVPVIKRSLVMDGNNNATSPIKYWDGSNWIDTGKVFDTLIENDYIVSGMTDTVLNAIIHAQWNLLTNTSSANLLNYTDDVTVNSATLKQTAVPQNQLVTASGDLDLTNSQNIDNITITGSNAKVVFSKDSGLTWYKWNGSSFVLVNLTASDVNTNGNTISEINAILGTDWTTFLDTKKIRFAYLLSQTNTADLSETDIITIQLDYQGDWQGAIHGTDYTYSYSTASGNVVLKVVLSNLAGKDVKINYYN